MIDPQYRKEYTKQHFMDNVEKDADYLVILEKSDTLNWSTIPSVFGVFETVDEAIEYFFSEDKTGKKWTTIRIYDLYAPFETSIIQSSSR